MPTKYKKMTEADVELFMQHIKMINKEVDRLKCVVQLLRDVQLTDTLMISLIDDNLITPAMFSSHPSITYELIDKFAEYFDIQYYLQYSQNINLIFDKRFTKRYNLSDEDILKFIERIKSISFIDLLNADIKQFSKDIQKALIEKTALSITKSEATLENLQKFEKTIGPKFYSQTLLKYLISKRIIDASIDDFNLLNKYNNLTPSIFYSSLVGLAQYPVNLENYLNSTMQKVNNNQFTTEDFVIPTELMLLKFSEDQMSKALYIFNKINNTQVSDSIFKAFQFQYPDVKEENVLLMLDIYRQKYTFSELLKTMNNRGYSKVVEKLKSGSI